MFKIAVTGGIIKVDKCPFRIVSGISNLLVRHCSGLNQLKIDCDLENGSIWDLN